MAQKIPDSVVEEIKARASIEEVVGQYVQLQRRGTRSLGLCPFHDEKTPSFSVNTERGLFHCFGCSASGDTIGFVMKHDGLSFPEAVTRLAERYGVTIPTGDPAQERQARAHRDARARYLDATTFAAAYFAKELWRTPNGPGATYLRERGVDRETAERFGLGFAPPGWSGLVDEAGRARQALDAFVEAGLIVSRDGGGHYDRFRHRLMFPVVNLSRQVLAFSGRTLDPEERAKYINSPETPYYTKGHELFGLEAARAGIQARGEAVLVEGNFDVVSLHARGLNHVCAALGTALTERQARLLKRFTQRVVLLFDADDAGRAAAIKALHVLLSVDMPEIVVCTLPDGTDPDDYVRAEGPDALFRRIERARPLLDVCIDDALANAVGRNDAQATRQAVDRVADLLAAVVNPIARQSYVDDIARRLDVEPERLVRYLKRVAERGPAPPAPSPGPDADAPRDNAVRPLDATSALMMEVLAGNERFLETIHSEKIHLLIEHAELASFLKDLSHRYAVDGEDINVADEVARLIDDGLRARITAVLARASTCPPEQQQRAFEDALTELKLRWIHREKRTLEEEVRRLEAEERFADALPLYARQQELITWTQTLRASSRG